MRWRGVGVRSLYLSIYLTVVATLLVFALVAMVLVSRHTGAERGRAEVAMSERTLALVQLLQNSLRFQREGIRRVIGTDPQAFQACYIRQVRHARGRFKALDKTGKCRAVFADQWACRWGRLYITAGHGAEKLIAHQLQRHRVSGRQRVDQRAVDIVAIHRKTAGRVGAVAAEQAGRAGLVRR